MQKEEKSFNPDGKTGSFRYKKLLTTAIPTDQYKEISKSWLLDSNQKEFQLEEWKYII